MAQKITWTPEGTEGYLGTVRLEPPTEPLTCDQYRFLLEAKIDRMVQAELEWGEMDPVELAEPLMWEYDRLVPGSVANLAELLAFHSETLNNKTTGRLIFPVAPAQIKDDPEAWSIIREQSLTEFLDDLYSPQNMMGLGM